MSPKTRGILGFLIMLLFIIDFIFGSIRMVLIGLGKVKDPRLRTKQKSKGAVVKGIIGLVIFSVAFMVVAAILIYGIFYV